MGKPPTTKLEKKDSHWIYQQHLFLVTTVSFSEGFVKFSPIALKNNLFILDEDNVWHKDADSLGLGECVCYLGPDKETIKNVRESGQITIMFVELEAAPQTIRIFGQGVVYDLKDLESEQGVIIPPAEPRKRFNPVIFIKIREVRYSCGYSIPVFKLKSFSFRQWWMVWKMKKQGRSSVKVHDAPIDNQSDLRSFESFKYLSGKILHFLTNQNMFFVASAPIGQVIHVNASPKGSTGTFHVRNKNQVWYEDLTGSGVETISHCRNERHITFTFLSFDGSSKVVQIIGLGTVYEFGDPEYATFIPERLHGSRAVILMDIIEVRMSIDLTLPCYSYVRERTSLDGWCKIRESKDNMVSAVKCLACADGKFNHDGLCEYWYTHNTVNLDGEPGLLRAPFSRKPFESRWRVPGPPKGRQVNRGIALIFFVFLAFPVLVSYFLFGGPQTYA